MKQHQEDQVEPFFITEEVEAELADCRRLRVRAAWLVSSATLFSFHHYKPDKEQYEPDREAACA